jgi:hypothetical protein
VSKFSTGTYCGARGAEQGLIWWDAGIYRLEDWGRLMVSTATDVSPHRSDPQAGRALAATRGAATEDQDGAPRLLAGFDGPLPDSDQLRRGRDG